MDELSLADYMGILRRWRKYFLTTFFVLWGLSIAVTLSWSTYRSTVTVVVQQPQVAPTMTTPLGMNPSDTPSSLADLRISRIEQKITSPATLVDIINKFNLYAGARARVPMEAVATKMASKIKLTLLSSDIANPAATQKVSLDQLSAIAFTLSYDYSDPETAQQVLNEIVTRFLDEDIKDRKANAEETSVFLEKQIVELEGSLAEQEKKIADFQNTNGAVAPETLMFNQQAVANATMSMQSLDSQIASNEGTQGALRAQLASVDPYSRVIADGQVLTTPAIQLKALEAQYTTLTAQYGAAYPDVVKVGHQIDALRRQIGGGGPDTAVLKAQIRDTETNLAAAKKSEGAEHPDVISLQRQLDGLKGQLATAKKQGERGLKEDADNPAYLALESQLQAAESQHKALLEQRRALATQQEKYQMAVIRNPELQQQMQSLSRDHENAELRHRELKVKKMAADMDVQMIQDRKGQRLEVISPPDLPLTTHPKRSLFFLGGLVFALFGGLASVVIAYAMNKSIFGPRQLASLVGTAPLVVVPYIYTETERHRSGAWRRFIGTRAVVSLLRLLPKNVWGGDINHG